MTLLELIRELQEAGKPVVAYDLFVCDNYMMRPEEAVSVGEYGDTTVRIADAFIPPLYLDLGDAPQYIYVEDAAAYQKLTRLKDKLPARYPRLMVVMFYNWNTGFFKRYEGKNWREIPPIEVTWARTDSLMELLLDKDGNLVDIVYGGIVGIDTPATYYPVRTPYGSIFSWKGDITRDPLPEGLTMIEK